MDANGSKCHKDNRAKKRNLACGLGESVWAQQLGRMGLVALWHVGS